MKTANLADKVLPNADYERLKATLGGMDARLDCQELQHGANAVELRKCRVWFDEETQIGNAATRAAFNLQDHWNEILGVCAHHGLLAV